MTSSQEPRPPIGADELRGWLLNWLSKTLDLPASEVRADRPFQDLGLSSRDAVVLVGELEELLDRAIPVTMMWELPDVDAVVSRVISVRDEPAPAPEPRLQATTKDADTDDSIALVGIGARLPGGITDAASFWTLLTAGGEGIREVPSERWDAFADPHDPALDTAVRRGGYLDDVAGFDADYFGLSRPEAELMDPQQRLLLEVAVESMQHAGIPVDELRGSSTGVYVGVSASEYSHLTTGALSGVESWTATGSALSIVANRLSYLFDLRGPSMAIDTACSSSLVALHTALNAMRAGECERALVAGVNLLLSPALMLALGRGGALADDARCKAFSDDADGIGRGEGCVAIVLERLSAARAADHRVLAVALGSAVNSDGRSNGITAPNGQAQRAVLKDAYARAGVDPMLVDYVEAHGTGTPLGDPIEAAALGAVAGAGRPADRPLLLGSVKTNLGHLEAAAGLAGVAKVALALQHGVLPASRNFRAANAQLDLDRDRLAIVTCEQDWPRASGRALAGVSGFGFGGTNAHVVLGEAPPAPYPATASEDAANGAAQALVLRAPTEANLRADAAALADHLDGADRNAVADAAATLLRHRGHGRECAAVLGLDASSLTVALRALSDGAEHPQVLRGTHTQGGAAAEDAVWVFSGYGAQWTGMGRELAAHEPVFAAALRDAGGHIVAAGGPPVHEYIAAGRPAADLVQAQLGLFATQVALAALWRARGERPAAVLGHSMGEPAAAVACGALTVAEAALIVTVRSRLLARIGGGGMAVLGVSPAAAEELLAAHPDVTIAVYGSPRQCTITGPQRQLDALLADVEARGLDAWPLQVDGAGHSAAIDPILPELTAALAGLRPKAPDVPMYSTVSEEPHGANALDAHYWAANARRPVRFTQALAAAAADGHTSFLEISAHPISTRAITATLDALGVGGAVAGSLQRGVDDRLALAAAAVRRHWAGSSAALQSLCAGGRRVDLPHTAWRHERYWFTPPVVDHLSAEHPLLGGRAELPDGRLVWTSRPGLAADPWLRDRAARPQPLLPLAAVAELALAAGASFGPARELIDAELTVPVAIGEHLELTTILTPNSRDRATVEVHARTLPGAPWQLCGRALVLRSADGGDLALPAAPAGALRAAPTESARTIPASRHGHDRRSGTVADPVVLDAMLCALAPPLSTVGVAPVPRRIGVLRVPAPLGRGGQALPSVRATGIDGALTGDVTLLGPDGEVLAEARDLQLDPIEHPPLPIEDLFFERRLIDAPAPSTDARPAPGTWLLLADPPTELAGLAEALVAAGGVVRVAPAGLAPSGAVAALQEAAGSARPSSPRGVAVQIPRGLASEGARAVLVALAALAVVLAETAPGTRLAILTEAAAAVDGEPGDPAGQALRALVRVLAIEHPELRCALVDRGRSDPWNQVVDELRLAADDSTSVVADDEVVLRGSRRRVSRLHRATLASTRSTGPVVGAGSYVITGGLGGLGLHAAQWLAKSGARRVVLSGRHADCADEDPTIAPILKRLRATDVEVVLVAGDVAGDEVADRIVAAATAGGMPLRGVMHAAGVLADQLVTDLAAENVAAVWAPKVDGCLRLADAVDSATGVELDWFVVYSSIAGLVGAPAQLAYATANAYLDAFMAARRAAGRPGTSIQWGAWARIGGGQSAQTLVELLEPEQGEDALAGALAADVGELAVARLDPAQVVQLVPTLGRRGFFAEFADVAEVGNTTSSWPGLHVLAGLEAETALRHVRELIAGQVAALLNVSAAELHPDATLTSLGLDSLAAMRARNGVQEATGIPIPTKLLLQGATLRDLETFLARRLGLAAPSAEATDEQAPGHASAHPAGSPYAPAGARAGWVPPRNLAERFLVGIWQDVLHRRPIGVHENFAELGGDEAAAELVAQRIRARLQWSPLPAQLLAHPTVEACAELVRARLEGSASTPLRVLRAPRVGGTREPLFLFHPAGGPSSVYVPLVERLAADQPVYGLDRIGELLDVESKAGRYVELVRAVQPCGPYRLAGWSFGGILAGEVAAQLQASGEEVELLARLDTILPLPGEQSVQQLLTDRFRRFGEYVIATYGARLEIDFDVLGALPEAAGVQEVFRALRDAGVGLPAGVLEHQYTSYTDGRIAELYQPKHFSGRAVLYRAEAKDVIATTIDPRYLRDDIALGWDRYCSDLEIVPVGGDHISMIDPPHIDTVAAHLDGILGAMTDNRSAVGERSA